MKGIKSKFRGISFIQVCFLRRASLNQRGADFQLLVQTWKSRLLEHVSEVPALAGSLGGSDGYHSRDRSTVLHHWQPEHCLGLGGIKRLKIFREPHSNQNSQITVLTKSRYLQSKMSPGECWSSIFSHRQDPSETNQQLACCFSMTTDEVITSWHNLFHCDI